MPFEGQGVIAFALHACINIMHIGGGTRLGLGGL